MNQNDTNEPISLARAGEPAGWLLDAEAKIIPAMTSQLVAQFLEMRADFAETLEAVDQMLVELRGWAKDQAMEPDDRELFDDHFLEPELHFQLIADKHFGAGHRLRAFSLITDAEPAGEVSGNAGDDPEEADGAGDTITENIEGAS